MQACERSFVLRRECNCGMIVIGGYCWDSFSSSIIIRRATTYTVICWSEADGKHLQKSVVKWRPYKYFIKIPLKVGC